MNRLISNITDAIALLFSNRLFVQALLAIAFVSIVFFILDNFDLGPFEATYYKNKLTIKFTIFSVIAALGVSAYLQSGATGLRQTKYYSEDSFWIHQDHSNSKISKIELSLNELQTKLNEQTIPTEQTEEEKSKLRSEAIEKITQETLQDIFKLQTIKLTESLKKETKTQRITELTNGILDRLRREISDLRLRSNTNLTIGMLITAGGLYLLWSTVSMVDSSELLKQLASEGGESDSKFLKNLFLPLIPRISLVIFIEIFAYFFLRLYKNGLDEIKYFQNELTNIESKLVSVEVSLSTQNPETLKHSLEALSKTERNFILEKGQTTVELEKAKSESLLTRNIIKTIPEILKRNRE